MRDLQMLSADPRWDYFTAALGPVPLWILAAATLVIDRFRQIPAPVPAHA